jgi:pyruvate/2-oxoglutarate/acetoin dehydrogenase E1 component
MKYIDAIRLGMEELAKQSNTIFLGYNVGCGSKASGTLKNVNQQQLFETPLAENLMMSLGVGMSLEAYYPVVYFERFDFILNAIDSIVNHLNKASKLSNGAFNPACLIRVAVGRKQHPFFSGLTHTQDFTKAMKELVNFPVRVLDINTSAYHITDAFVKHHNQNFMTVEYMDLYDETIKDI